MTRHFNGEQRQFQIILLAIFIFAVMSGYISTDLFIAAVSMMLFLRCARVAVKVLWKNENNKE